MPSRTLARALLSTLCAGVLLGAPALARAEPVVLDRVVAIINDDIILDSELEEFVRTDEEVFAALNQLGANPDEERVAALFREMRSPSLDRLIGRRLVLSEGARLQVEASDQELATYLGNVATNYGMSVEELQTAVESSGQFGSWAEYQAKLREDIVIYKLEMSLAPYSVSEAQIRAEYTKMIGSEDAQVKVVRLRFAAADDSSSADDRAFAAAKKAARRLRAGENADAVAHDSGVTAEPFTYDRGKAAPVIRESLFEVRVGEAVGPLNTPQGYLVFKVLEIDEAAVLPFEEAKEAIAQRLDGEARKRAEHDLHERLRAQAHVDIRL